MSMHTDIFIHMSTNMYIHEHKRSTGHHFVHEHAVKQHA